MFLNDPALRAIAKSTGDVHAEHIWRHETAAADSRGQLARVLHKTTIAFNDNADLLGRLLTQLTLKTTELQTDLGEQAFVRENGIDRVLTEVLSKFQQHRVLEQMLIDVYLSWVANWLPDTATSERHLLVQPRQPRFGVVTLRQRYSSDTWVVVPDAVAAKRFGVPYAGRIIGGVVFTDEGWQPTAYTDPAHAAEMTYRLPGHDDLAVVCRTLLRWWQLRHSAQWRSRTPDQLTADELAALAI